MSLVQITKNLFESPLLKSFGLVLNMTEHLVLCLPCEAAYQPAHISGHLKDKHQITLSKEQSAQLNNVFAMHNIHTILPTSHPSPIPAIEGIPIFDSFVCNFQGTCRYLSPKKHTVERHQRRVHTSDIECSETVPAQRYNSGSNKTYFEVFRAELPTVNPLSTEEILQNMKKQIDESQKALIAEEDVRNVTPWLRKTRWNEHFRGFDTAELCTLASHPKMGEFPGLQEAVLHMCMKASDLFDKTSILALQYLNSPDPDKKGINNTPFHHLQNHDTAIKTYIYPTVDLLAMLLRPKKTYEIDLPDDIKSKLLELSNNLCQPKVTVTAESVFEVLSLLWTRTWLRHVESIIVDPTVHYLAMSSINSNGSFCHAKDLTNVIARLEYVMRLVFLLMMHKTTDPDSAYQDLQVWFIEKHESTFNTLRDHQHMASTIAYGSVSLPKIVWIDSEGHRSMLYRGYFIHFDKFPAMFAALEEEMKTLWEETILCGLPLYVKYKHLCEDLAEDAPGYSFITDARNECFQNQTRLASAILADPELRKQFLISQSGDHIMWNIHKIRKWLGSYSELQLLQACRFIMTSGSPSRITELTAMLRANTPAHPSRNLVLFGKYVTLICTYQKTSALMGNDKCIPHALDGFASDLLIQDLALARPFAELAAHLCYSTEAVYLYRNHVFVNADRLFRTDEITARLEGLTLKHLGVKLGSASWRQVSIAFRRKICPRLDALLEEDGQESIQSLQSGHNRGTENRIYGVSADAMAGASEDLLPKFLDASTDWQVACKVVPGGLRLPYTKCFAASFRDLVQSGQIVMARSKAEIAEMRMMETMESMMDKHTEKMTRLFAAQMEKFCSLLAKPLSAPISIHTSPTINPTSEPEMTFTDSDSDIEYVLTDDDLERACIDKLRELLKNPAAEPSCPEQLAALVALLKLKDDLIVIMPTGSGKTMLTIIPALLEKNLMTVVYIPLRALLMDYERRYKEMDIPYEVYEGKPIRGQTNILLVSADVTDREIWREHIVTFNEKKKVVRQIVDEGQIPLVDHVFRPALEHMFQLRVIESQLAVFSASIPESAEDYIIQQFGLGDNLLKLRASTNRPELQYTWNPPTADKDLEATIGTALQKYQSTNARDRSIIYVSTYDIGNRLGMHLRIPFYHSSKEVAEKDKLKMFNDWLAGTPATIISTAAFGAGLDYGHTRLVIHAGTPKELINYTQEVSRAGRDKQAAKCILFPTWIRKPTLDDDAHDFGGKRAMYSALSGPPVCIRFIITSYNDRTGTLCKDSPENQWCSVCKDTEQRKKRNLTAAFQTSTEQAKRQKIQLDLTSHDYVTNFKKQLRKFEDKCTYCMLHGASRPEQHALPHCPTLKSFDEGKEYDRYFKWRRSLSYSRGQRVCFVCHVPQGKQDALHRQFVPRSTSACDYPDVIAPIAFYVFQTPNLCASASIHFQWNFTDIGGFTAWLNDKPISGYESNITALFLWFSQGHY